MRDDTNRRSAAPPRRRGGGTTSTDCGTCRSAHCTTGPAPAIMVAVAGARIIPVAPNPAVMDPLRGGPSGTRRGARPHGQPRHSARQSWSAEPALSGASAKLLRQLARRRPRSGARGGAAVYGPRRKDACARQYAVARRTASSISGQVSKRRPLRAKKRRIFHHGSIRFR